MERNRSKYIKILLWGFLFWGGCCYHTMTHLSSEDLKPIDIYELHDSIFFKSNQGDVDTMFVRKIYISNSFNPIARNGFNVTYDYEAYAALNFNIQHNGLKLDGFIALRREKLLSPASVGFYLNGRFTELDMKPFFIQEYNGSFDLSDCIIVDDFNSINRNKVNPIESYVWSQSRGLVQYTFKNGEIYDVTNEVRHSKKKRFWNNIVYSFKSF